MLCPNCQTPIQASITIKDRTKGAVKGAATRIYGCRNPECLATFSIHTPVVPPLMRHTPAGATP